MKKTAKETLSLFLAMLMLLSCFAGVSFEASAAQIKSQTINKVEYSYFIKDKKATIITAYMENSVDDLKFPSKLGNCPVTTIGGDPKQYPAVIYDWRNAIKTVTFPDSVTTINYVFAHSDSLSKVILGKNVKTINANPFNNCKNIKKYVVNSGNKYFSTDKKGNLYNKSKTKLVKYTSASSAKKFALPSTVKSIGYGAFSDATKLTQIILNKNIKTIPNDMCYNCSKLSSLKCNTPFTKVGSNAFCGTAITKLRLPKTVTSVGYSAFASCSKLASVDLSATKLKKIPDNMFTLSAVSEVKIPSTVTAIGNGAFSSTKLSSLAGFEKVTKLGEYSFSFCKNLKTIDVSKLNVTEIPFGCFEGCSKSTSVKLPSSVTKIGAYSFEDSGLKNVTLPKTITTIGEGAFSYSSLQSIDLSKTSVKSLQGTFSGTTSLTSVKLPSTLKEIGTHTFYNSGLKSIKLPKSVVTLGEYAFYNCEKLTSVDASATAIKLIDTSTFCGCNKLNDVKLPNTLKNIGDNAFEHCYALKTLVIPASVEEVEVSAFNDDTLDSVTFLGAKTQIAGGYTSSDNIALLIAPAGSEIETYAMSSDIPFQAL